MIFFSGITVLSLKDKHVWQERHAILDCYLFYVHKLFKIAWIYSQPWSPPLAKFVLKQYSKVAENWQLLFLCVTLKTTYSNIRHNWARATKSSYGLPHWSILSVFCIIFWFGSGSKSVCLMVHLESISIYFICSVFRPEKPLYCSIIIRVIRA